ncbi:putative serine/arginine-rich splicing factor RS2Z33-like isoform X1 [Capsicum annuum]|nr:putative serine/arginine-rich splicing factor RS2Z33-like isoform X1 [Capsicum annuum]
MDTSLIHIQSPYIEMMKNNFLFFRSSTNDANKTPLPPLKSKEVSSWRSVSLSSGSFYDSGSRKKNFTDMSKSLHGHSKKVHPKRSGCDSSRKDLSVLVLIRTIRRLTKEKVQMASEVSSMLRNQVAERAYAKEEASILQADLAAIVRGNDILKCEVQNALDALSYAIPKLKYIEIQVLKKNKNINQLTNDLQECMKELGIVKVILRKVFQERDFMWEEVKSYSKMNMLLNYEINMLKRKVDTLDEDFLMKEGQITILKDSIGNPFDLLPSPDSLLEPNAFSNNNSSILSCIQTTVDIPSQIVGPSTFELSNHALVGPGREGGVRGSASWTSICWFTCSTSCVFYPVWSDSKGIKLAWGYNISCRDNPWYFGHCISYAVVVSLPLGATVSLYLSVTDPLAARRDALQSTVIRLREGFRKKDQNSSASSSEGCGSSVKCSSSADAGHLGNETVPCTGDGST